MAKFMTVVSDEILKIMNKNRLTRLFPNASSSFIKQNSDPETESDRPSSKLERDKFDAPLSGSCDEEKDSAKFIVCITSVRKRLLDEDNICEKYLIDALRYSGAIPADSPETTHIITSQKKVAKGEEEHTLIEVYVYDRN